MSEFDDHVAIMGDWMSLNPNARALFSSMIGDGVIGRSVAESSTENRDGSLRLEPDIQVPSRSTDQKNEIQNSLVSNIRSQLNPLSEQKLSSHGSLVERMAARAGFNAPRLNTESIGPNDLSQKQEIQTPCLTVPPDLSPATLLDSPVFLSNTLVMPSPTTGKFSFAPNGTSRNSTLMTDNPDKGKDNLFEEIDALSFTFKPVTESGSSPYTGAACKTDFSRSSIQRKKSSDNISSEPRNFDAVGSIAGRSSPLDGPENEDADQRVNADPNVGGGPAVDGYNWRKYGQKQVKGSEYPWSYYKCTHENCPVKKKVECSCEGYITEITYKGAHNHSKPLVNGRSALGTSNALGDMQLDTTEQPDTGFSDHPVWPSVPQADWGQDSVELTPLGQEYCNGATSLPAQTHFQFELGDDVDGSSTFSDDEDDRGTHGSISLAYDGEGDESESKRRRIETHASEMSGATRAISEPRVVVQTTSEVDILEDGYRWRKYGQKVVKGNPNPRSYYKCTSAGCNVRKHVERASHDLKSVITTYEGKHKHDVPAARNRSNINTLPTQPHAAFTRTRGSEPSQNMEQIERTSLDSFGLPRRPQFGPTYAFGFGMNQSGQANLAMAGLGPNPYFGQQAPIQDMPVGFMLPKGKLKSEPKY
ncbi:probable WRKY transcription factor 2 isoform X1 [Olea europaea subsp. europaea]|uniref:Probable WRKY transcription factor 2 isoform X1 n=1 Tax=Olea europaea subsp. europaea TaxID=158383 RepID=A0A8S0T0M1_OLEEU|nr:probable WRKY transcription factor 2 isoform X1 [Olea europaea subsp. europaea]